MKGGVYSLLKAKYLVDHGAMKNWRFIIFLVMVAILMIGNTHRYEQKIFRITELGSQVKELHSKFVDTRSELMDLKLESTISKKMEEKEIFPSSVPPKKIKVIKEEEKTTMQKIWQ